MDENETLNEIFGQTPIWKGKYKIKWCEMCRTATIVCETCKNSSCNGGGCKECDADFTYFISVKTTIEEYLTDEEIEVYHKADYLKKFILDSLGKGEREIDFNRMERDGELSEVTKKMFLKK
jgi:hypothetical protein